MERRTILFSGDVQGVGFRMTTVQLGRGLAVAGTVRNLADSRVELIVEGPKKDIETLLARLGEHFEGLIRTTQQDVSPAGGPLGPGIRIVH